MNKFIRKHDIIYREIAKVNEDNNKFEFSELWQQGKYAEALNNHFPRRWEWLGRNIKKQLICDYPMNVGAGEVVSERAFTAIHEAFPEETKLNRSFEIDGLRFVWFSPPVIEKEAFDGTSLNIFMVRPGYTTTYSEDFVNLWKDNGFTGHEFVEMN